MIPTPIHPWPAAPRPRSPGTTRAAARLPFLLPLLGLLLAGLLAGCAPEQGDAGACPAARSVSPSAETVRFVAFGDQGTGTQAQYDVAAAVADKCLADGCDFGVLLGDNFYPTGVDSVDDPQWGPKFVQPYGDLGFPFYAVLGNHDYGGNGAGDEFGKGRYQVAYAGRDARWIMPGECYHFDTAPATFLALGTNLLTWDHQDAVHVQGNAFAAILNDSGRPWRIALGHHPYVSNGAHGNAGSYDGTPGAGQAFKDFFDATLCGRIDLYLAGHDHNVQVLPGPAGCPGTFVVAGSGGGNLYGLPGSNPARFQASLHGFVYLVADRASLALQVIAADGTLAYAETLAAPR